MLIYIAPRINQNETLMLVAHPVDLAALGPTR